MDSVHNQTTNVPETLQSTEEETQPIEVDEYGVKIEKIRQDFDVEDFKVKIGSCSGILRIFIKENLCGFDSLILIVLQAKEDMTKIIGKLEKDFEFGPKAKIKVCKKISNWIENLESAAKKEREQLDKFGITPQVLNRLKVKKLSNFIMVRNLPYDITEEDLRQIFDQIRPIKSLGHRRDDGSAVIQFLNELDALETVSIFNGSVFRGRKLRVFLRHQSNPAWSYEYDFPKDLQKLKYGFGQNGGPA